MATSCRLTSTYTPDGISRIARTTFIDPEAIGCLGEKPPPECPKKSRPPTRHVAEAKTRSVDEPRDAPVGPGARQRRSGGVRAGGLAEDPGDDRATTDQDHGAKPVSLLEGAEGRAEAACEAALRKHRV
jgi:hypothetical protein